MFTSFSAHACLTPRESSTGLPWHIHVALTRNTNDICVIFSFSYFLCGFEFLVYFPVLSFLVCCIVKVFSSSVYLALHFLSLFVSLHCDRPSNSDYFHRCLVFKPHVLPSFFDTSSYCLVCFHPTVACPHPPVFSTFRFDFGLDFAFAPNGLCGCLDQIPLKWWCVQSVLC